MTPTERKLLRMVATALLDTRMTIMREGINITLEKGPDDLQIREVIAALDGEEQGRPSFVSVQRKHSGEGTLFVCRWPSVYDGKELVGRTVLIDGERHTVACIETDGLAARGTEGHYIGLVVDKEEP